MALEVELNYFRENLGEWLKHYSGKYALVRVKELAGFFDTAESAFSTGVGKWGNVPFLVRKVTAEDEIEQSPALAFGLIHADF